MAFDEQFTALTVFCEASNASTDERRAVTHVIFNRLADGRFGKSLAEVCLKRFQFSEWNDDLANNNNLIRGARTSDNDTTLQDCVSAFKEIKYGCTVDMTDGATHYHDKSILPPSWAHGATKTLETNKFIFYKDVK